MLCDFSPVRNFLIGVGVSIGVAIVFAGLAAAALVFFWTWWLAPLFTGAAAATLLVASLLVNWAREAAFQYYSCMIQGVPSSRSQSACWGQWQNFRNSAIALTTTLGILAATAGALAGSFMGWWSAPDLAVLIGGIVANAIMIPTMLVFLKFFRDCLQST